MQERDKFVLKSKYQPTGDQPKAIKELVESIRAGHKEQTLLGVTGSGKTFTMANVIAELNRPTLVLAHNKTLAAQLCSEFREFFPENAVEYFISYYDYYQPEAYIAQTDTYIEKDSAINDEIERLRHSATSALSERRDVIVVSSVSCIYGLGDPIDYKNMVISLRPGMEYDRDELMRKLTEIRYERNDLNFVRNAYRVRGDTLEVYPAYWSGRAIRIEFFGDEIDRISEVNAVTGVPERILNHVAIYPASHYVASREKMARAMKDIEAEMWEQVRFFEEHDKLLEAQRIRQRLDLRCLHVAILRSVYFTLEFLSHISADKREKVEFLCRRVHKAVRFAGSSFEIGWSYLFPHFTISIAFCSTFPASSAAALPPEPPFSTTTAMA